MTDEVTIIVWVIIIKLAHTHIEPKQRVVRVASSDSDYRQSSKQEIHDLKNYHRKSVTLFYWFICLAHAHSLLSDVFALSAGAGATTLPFIGFVVAEFVCSVHIWHQLFRVFILREAKVQVWIGIRGVI